MKTFEYTTREYTPSIDLNTLGQTFSTLEQGHKEAVKAASDLEVAVANLDMNEAEDGFKQQLINEIKTTVDDNTIYGNSYGALDDLIMQAGNVASDGRVIGRLRSQAAKKEYDKKVDSMNIPDGMKQMYKEQNAYHYEDGGIDERTGRYIPGETWKPITNPVTNVPETEIQKYALQIAAKDAGGGEGVYFLDAAGRPTTDPSQSEDGTIYKKIGTKFERLTEDKIREAYKVAIASIPGAEDSLRQDYDYAEWQRDKLAKSNEEKGENPAPYIPGLTDKNGNVYKYEQWLDNKINGFADVSAYNHVYSSVDYGTALQNRRTREATAKQQAGVNQSGTKDGGFGTYIIGTKEVDGNSFAGAQKAKAAANEQGLSIVKHWMNKTYGKADSVSDVIQDLINKGLATGPNTAAQYFIKRYEDRMSNEDKIRLTNSFVGYVKANQQYNELLKAAGDNADALMFSADIANNTFTNNNKYSREIINKLNSYYKHNDTADWKVGSQILEGIAKKYGTSITGLKTMGINITQTDDGNYNVSIDAEHRNLLPKFASTIRSVNSEIPGTFGGWLTNKFTTGVASTNYYEYGSGAQINDLGWSSKAFTSLASYYDNAVEKSADTEEKVGITKGTVTFHGTDGASFGGLWYRENATNLGLKESELQSIIKRQDGQVDLMFANGNFDSGSIEELDASGKAVKTIANAQEIKSLIQKMYNNDTWANSIKRTVVIPTGGGMGQPKGYALSLTIPKGAATSNYKEGEHYRFIVSGVMEEEINYDPSFNPNILASNSMLISRATGSNVEAIGYDEDFGDTRLVAKKDGTYDTSFMGSTKNLTYDEAEQYVAIFNTLEQLKSQYNAGVFHDSQAHVEQLYNSLQVIATNLSNITDVNANDIAMIIGNYLNNAD